MKKHERLCTVTIARTPTTTVSSGKSTNCCRRSGCRQAVGAGLVLLLLTALVRPVRAVEITGSKGEALRRNHQVGVRLGVWSNSGQLPRASDSVGSYWYIADVKDASFYAELYLGIRVMRPLILRSP